MHAYWPCSFLQGSRQKAMEEATRVVMEAEGEEEKTEEVAEAVAAKAEVD